MAARSNEPVAGQGGLFDEPARDAVRAPRVPAPTGGPVAYSDYQGLARCADCELLVYQELQGVGSSTHLIRRARTRRKDGFAEQLLCPEHANLRREAEALAREKKL